MRKSFRSMCVIKKREWKPECRTQIHNNLIEINLQSFLPESEMVQPSNLSLNKGPTVLSSSSSIQLLALSKTHFVCLLFQQQFLNTKNWSSHRKMAPYEHDLASNFCSFAKVNCASVMEPETIQWPANQFAVESSVWFTHFLFIIW